jgi:hypothetical protein
MALVGAHLMSDADKARADLPLTNLVLSLLDKSGYMHQQATRPDTLGVGMQESPVALAAWILEKFHAWSGCQGVLEGCLSKRALLNNVMVYWLNGKATSAMRFYKESLVCVRTATTCATHACPFPLVVCRRSS